MQSKKHSLVETVVNGVTSYGIAIVMNYYLVPLVYPEVKPTVSGAAGYTFMFAAVSMLRTYLFRRLFARWERCN